MASAKQGQLPYLPAWVLMYSEPLITAAHPSKSASALANSAGFSHWKWSMLSSSTVGDKRSQSGWLFLYIFQQDGTATTRYHVHSEMVVHIAWFGRSGKRLVFPTLAQHL